MTVDPALVDLLERSSLRSVEAVGRLEDSVADLRRALDDARRATDEDRRLEADRFHRLHSRMDELATTVGEVDRRCGALVLEEEQKDGTTVVRARPARIGLDVKTVAGLVVTLVVALLSSPLILEVLK